jgi:uncharacterized membrane protein YfcA
MGSLFRVVKKNVPLINYDVASIMEPTTLIGSVVGVMLNHILPDWLILVLLVSFLAYTTKHSFLKGEEVRDSTLSVPFGRSVLSYEPRPSPFYIAPIRRDAPSASAHSSSADWE